MGGTSHGRQMNSTCFDKELMSTGERHGDVRHVCALAFGTEGCPPWIVA
jgi:hypothetical protein